MGGPGGPRGPPGGGQHQEGQAYYEEWHEEWYEVKYEGGQMGGPQGGPGGPMGGPQGGRMGGPQGGPGGQMGSQQQFLMQSQTNMNMNMNMNAQGGQGKGLNQNLQHIPAGPRVNQNLPRIGPQGQVYPGMGGAVQNMGGGMQQGMGGGMGGPVLDMGFGADGKLKVGLGAGAGQAGYGGQQPQVTGAMFKPGFGGPGAGGDGGQGILGDMEDLERQVDELKLENSKLKKKLENLSLGGQGGKASNDQDKSQRQYLDEADAKAVEVDESTTVDDSHHQFFMAAISRACSNKKNKDFANAGAEVRKFVEEELEGRWVCIFGVHDHFGTSGHQKCKKFVGTVGPLFVVAFEIESS